MKFEHSINELGLKKTVFSIFDFMIFGRLGVKNHNFGRGGYQKNPIKWSKMKKSENNFFSSIYSNFVLKFHNATIKIE